MNISGGTVMMGAAVADEGWALILGYNGTGVLNMSGTGVIDFKGTDAAKGWLFASARAEGTSVVNLGKVDAGSGGGGGTITKAAYIKGTAGNSTFNFHGGTLVAEESLNPFNIGVVDSFFDNFTHSYIYPEGAKLSVDAGHTAKIAQIFEDPAGKGVSSASITVADGGSGYIGTPLVTITGGGPNAYGATANAVIDSDGHVTEIVITNPGINYTEAPTIQITGGGGTGAAANANASAFVTNTAGPLVKLGDGTLTLTGASTRTGNTVVDAGTLNVPLGINTPNATVYVATGGTLNTPSIVADTLTIGGAPLAASAATVPEPGTLALLALAAMGWAAWMLRKK
jgi:autotransporter-associated beta strand protein